MFDKNDAELTKTIHDNSMARMAEKVAKYSKDPSEKERLEKNLCKYCMYSKFDSWAGQAFTNENCKECGKEMTFGTTDTDKYCDECAKKLNVCKHCGQIMD